MRPVVVRSLLRPFAIDARQALTRRCLNTRGLRQVGQELVIRGARVTPHDAAQGRVGFQRGRVNADRLALDQTGVSELPKNPREDGVMRFEIDQTAGARNRRMIGRRLGQHQSQKLAQGERIRRTPRNGALRIEAFEVADQQQTEVAPRRQTRTTDVVRVESLTKRLDVTVEVRFLEDLIQARVERMRSASRQVLCGHPHRSLLRTTPLFAHRHWRQCRTGDRACRSNSILTKRSDRRQAETPQRGQQRRDDQNAGDTRDRPDDCQRIAC